MVRRIYLIIALVILCVSIGFNVIQFFKWVDCGLDNKTESLNRHVAELKVDDFFTMTVAFNPEYSRSTLYQQLKKHFPKDEIKDENEYLNWRNLYFQFDASGKLINVE